MKSLMNEANTTPLLSPAIDDDPEPELDNGKKAIERTSSIELPNEQEHHSWLIPFLVNIFLANAAASVIQPSLAPYLTQLGVHESYLPWVIFMHNIGGAIGSATMGVFYDYVTRICQVEGRGAKICLLVCPMFGIVGSALYASAGWMGDVNEARWFILFGRLFQGIWRGGQTSVEQGYLSTAVEPSVKTEYTATLGTFAVLGAVIGPSIGALFSQIDTTVYGLTLDANNVPGFLILVGTLIMFVQTLLFFDGKHSQTDTMNMSEVRKICHSNYTLETEESNSDEEDHPFNNEEIVRVQDTNAHSVHDDTGILNCGRSLDADTDETSSYSENKEFPVNTRGVLVCIYVNTCLFYCFAVQETITTPMVIKLYNWSATEINLLFAIAGFISLVASISLRYISRHTQDRTLLIAGIGIGLLGTLLQMDIPHLEKVLPESRFISGFLLTYMGFPIGRIVVMSVFSNVLGPSNQGTWMGVITAAGAMARAITPFIAWQAMQAVNWNTWLDFGVCSLLLFSSLVGVIVTIGFLVPYSEFVGVPSLP